MTAIRTQPTTHFASCEPLEPRTLLAFTPGAAIANIAGNPSDSDIFLLKLDTNGNYVAATKLATANNDDATSLAVDKSGFVYVGGRAGVNAVLAKFSGKLKSLYIDGF